MKRRYLEADFSLNSEEVGIDSYEIIRDSTHLELADYRLALPDDAIKTYKGIPLFDLKRGINNIGDMRRELIEMY